MWFENYPEIFFRYIGVSDEFYIFAPSKWRGSSPDSYREVRASDSYPSADGPEFRFLKIKVK